MSNEIFLAGVTVVNENEIIQKSIHDLIPHPDNARIYHTKIDQDLVKLMESISKEGLLSPFTITKDNYILSGHRRRLAYLSLLRRGAITKELVPCQVRDCLHTDENAMVLLREFNRQRNKDFSELAREAIIDVSKNPQDLENLYRDHIEANKAHAQDQLVVTQKKQRSEISDGKQIFLDNIKQVLEERREYLPLSDRQIHYALLNFEPFKVSAQKKAKIYGNNKESYNNLTNLLSRARINGEIDWYAISDETRPQAENKGYCNVSPYIKTRIENFSQAYRRNLQQSQPNHIEIIGEKNTIHSIIEKVAYNYSIPYTIGRGYCSLAPKHDLVQRYSLSGKNELILLFLGDFDPDGEAIVDTFIQSLEVDFRVSAKTIKAYKVALTYDQSLNMRDNVQSQEAKKGSKQTKGFYKKYGEGTKCYELEAIPPATLEKMLSDKINEVLDIAKYNAEVREANLDIAKLKKVEERFCESGLNKMFDV